MIGGKQELLDTIATMHAERHAHLYQYIDAVVGPSALTLREAAAAMGVSHQRVAQLKEKGQEQKARGTVFDLSRWPQAELRTPRPTRTSVPPSMVARLRDMNAKAKAYRKGDDPREALAFYRLVGSLHAEGITYRAIARTLGEHPRSFTRRLARWGVTEGSHGRTALTVPAERGNKA